MGQRVGHPQLEDGGLGEDLLGVLVGHAAGDDAQAPVAHLHAVVGEGFGELGQPLDAFLDNGVSLAGVGGHHDVFGGIHTVLGRPLPCLRSARPQLHHGVGVGDAGGDAQHDRGVEPLAHLQRHPHQILGLLAVCGLQAGDAGELGVAAVVLLVLGGVHGGVVGGDDDQPCLQAGHRGVEKGVGGHVEAHVLHHCHGPAAGVGRADGHVQGHLLVGAPLAVHVGVAGQLLEDLRAGGARIGRRHLHTGLPGPSGDGRVAG